MNNRSSNTQSNPLDEEDVPAYPPPAYPPPPTDPRPSTPQPAADSNAPPAWEASAGESTVARLYPYGVYHDAGRNNYERGVRFVHMHPDINPPQLIPLEALDLIRTHGPGAWTLTLPSRFDGEISRNRSGTTQVKSTFSSWTDKTVLSSLPLLWGKYAPPESSKGVYYEVTFDKVGRDTTIAVGFGCYLIRRTFDYRGGIVRVPLCILMMDTNSTRMAMAESPLPSLSNKEAPLLTFRYSGIDDRHLWSGNLPPSRKPDRGHLLH